MQPASSGSESSVPNRSATGGRMEKQVEIEEGRQILQFIDTAKTGVVLASHAEPRGSEVRPKYSWPLQCDVNLAGQK